MSIFGLEIELGLVGIMAILLIAMAIGGIIEKLDERDRNRRD